MCQGTRLPVVFVAVWAVANSCQVVVGRREHLRVYIAVGGGVGSGHWPYAPGIRPPRGPGGCASRSPRMLGIMVAVYTSRNSRRLGSGGPVGTCVGTRGHQEGFVVGGWQPGQGSCCSRDVGGCGLG